MKIWRSGIFAVLVIAGAAGIIWLKQDNARLRSEAAGWRTRNRELAPMREENCRLRAAAARAEAARETGSEARAMGTANHDPEKGLVALENFRNIGRASPDTAFQTAIWAIVDGDDDMLADVIALTDAARKKADGLLAELPDTARAKYASPEKLVGLFFSAGVLIDADGFQIVGQDYADARHATVRLRTDRGKDDKFPMQLGPNGWQLIVPENAISVIELMLKYPKSSQNTSGLDGSSNTP